MSKVFGRKCEAMLRQQVPQKSFFQAVYLLGVVLFALESASDVDALTRPGEKAALLAFRSTWASNSSASLFDNWKIDSDPCKDGWAGVFCTCDKLPDSVTYPCEDDGTFSHVLGLRMLEASPETFQLDLRGTIPAEFADLTDLIALDLSYTNLTGSVPDAVISSLADLKYLMVQNNQLTGPLPSTLSQLEHLKLADFSYNNFSGSIPGEWCQFKSPDGVVNVRDNNELCGAPDIIQECLKGGFSNVTWGVLETDGGVTLLTDNFDASECCTEPQPLCDAQQGCGVMVMEYLPPLVPLSFNYTLFSSDDNSKYNYAAELVPIYGKNEMFGSKPLTDVYGDTSDLILKNTHDNVEYSLWERTYGGDAEFVGVFRNRTVVEEQWNTTFNRGNDLSGDLLAVRIVATHKTCNKRSAAVLSRSIQRISSGPVSVPVFNKEGGELITTQKANQPLTLSWVPWTDDDVPCCWYWVQWWDITQTSNNNITDRIFVGANVTYTQNTTGPHAVTLQPGRTYRGTVYGTHLLGMQYEDQLWGSLNMLVTYREGPPVEVTDDSMDIGLVIGLTVGFGVLIPLMIGVFFFNWWRVKTERDHHRQLERLRKRQEVLSRLMYVVATHKRDKGDGVSRKDSDPFGTCQELAFVVTDLENSTACAAADRTAYKAVQQTHDQIMRECIAEFNGYEVVTEGDSFQVAFLTIAAAVKWALEIQRRLLEVDWEPSVLKLPSCHAEYVNSIRSFYGPRVRMGIHWATKGTFKTEEHCHTRTRIFPGPSWMLAQEVGDIGWGGQVLMTHDAWDELSRHMADAQFPVVRSIGLYNLTSWAEPIWLYEVGHQVGRPLLRSFPSLKKLQPLLPGRHYRLFSSPITQPQHDISHMLNIGVSEVAVSGASSSLTTLVRMASSSTWISKMVEMAGELKAQVFVIARIEKWVSTEESADSPTPWLQRIERWMAEEDMMDTLPSWILQPTYDILAIVALQFHGYVVDSEFKADSITVVFSDVHSALNFCHSAQVMLLVTDWTHEPKHSKMGSFVSRLRSSSKRSSIPHIVGPTVKTAEGRLLFCGPRVAMLIHQTADVKWRQVNSGGWYRDRQYWEADVECYGPGLDLARQVNHIIYGGQVVLTDEAWGSLKEAAPSGVQVYSLGSHVTSTDFPSAIYLVEVLPTMLQMRFFPPLRSLRMISPGFRESPDPAFSMAICFMKVAKPQVVTDALCAHADLTDESLRSTLTTYFSSVILTEQLARQLLATYDGYECKNPEPGKFTLAFRDLEMAVRYCVALQRDLMHLPWPSELTQWEECCPVVKDDGSGVMLWRGLRVRCGITWGKADSRKALNTGRADYFGSVANMSARIMSIAEPGQVLVQGTNRTRRLGAPVPGSGTTTTMEAVRYLGENWRKQDTIILQPVGYYELKGFSDLVQLYSACPLLLQSRSFVCRQMFMEPPRKFKRSKLSFLARLKSDADDNDDSLHSVSSSDAGAVDVFFAYKNRRPAPPPFQPSTKSGSSPVPLSSVSERASPTTGVSEKASPNTGASEKASPTTGISEKASPNTGISEKASPITGISEKASPNTGISEKASPTPGVSVPSPIPVSNDLLFSDSPPVALPLLRSIRTADSAEVTQPIYVSHKDESDGLCSTMGNEDDTKSSVLMEGTVDTQPDSSTHLCAKQGFDQVVDSLPPDPSTSSRSNPSSHQQPSPFQTRQPGPGSQDMKPCQHTAQSCCLSLDQVAAAGHMAELYVMARQTRGRHTIRATPRMNTTANSAKSP